MGPHENSIKLSSGTLYIDGERFSEITDCECIDADVYSEDDEPILRLNDSSEATFELNLTSKDYRNFIGLIVNWLEMIYQHCPNRRVAHLIRHGKNLRIRKKNLKRAIDILVKVLEANYE